MTEKQANTNGPIPPVLPGASGPFDSIFDSIFTKLEIREVYVVHQGDNDVSNGKPAWVYTDKLKAEHVAKGRGYYGGNAPIQKRYAVVNCGLISTCEPIALLLQEPVTKFVVNQGPVDDAEIMKAALDKLTPIEKKLLGIPECYKAIENYERSKAVATAPAEPPVDPKTSSL